ncbi:MAG: hypothetical protein A2Z71_06650 [Chloroflexi bacterium RBG_13_50_21]|nr:MAG: hypothetical protein A2Z71_06650 [Chloroflexi bacterium RBG_13_50_21]OGO66695.1 MAG: hypothetical protein A2029_04560 [Chloroflexi bacterium RBG_19FT_COMBO_47_9]
MLKRVSPSVLIYWVILVVIVILRLLFSLFPSEQIASQMVNLTDNLSIGSIWLVGWVGVFLAPRTGFADMWQKDITNLKRWLIPFLIGLGFGLLSIIFDLLQPLGEGSLIKFPASLVAYPLAGILEEIIFRLFLTTTIVWIISEILLRGRWKEAVFWGTSIFLGIFYTLSQLNLYQNLAETLDILVLVQFFTMIAANFIVAAFLYRKYGFLAALSMRMGDYLLWHILWGAIAKG